MKTQRLLLLVLLFSAMGSRAQVAFQVFPNGGPAIYSGNVSCIGDVNGDGRADVVVGTWGFGNNPAGFNNVLRVWLQNTIGGLATPVNFPYASGPNAPTLTGIDIADVNNDGRSDIVFSYGDSLGIRYQSSLGTLLPQQALYSGTQARACKAGDLNADGLTDIVTSNGSSDSNIRVYLQTANGFTSTTYAAPAWGNNDEIEIGDVDGDGLQDICLMRGPGGTGQLRVYTQTASNTFNAFVTYPVPNTQSWNLRGIEVADVNDDGLTDVVGTRGSFFSYSVVTWLQDDTTHLLQTPTQLSLNTIAFPVEAADFDCDGLPEIVTAGSSGQGFLTVIAIDSGEGYQVDTTMSITQVSGLHPQALSVGDFTGDNRKDIAIADFNYGVILLKNVTPNTNTVTTLLNTDTLFSTVTVLQQFFFNTTGVSTAGGYTITRTDSFRVDVVSRFDSLRIDSTVISNYGCADAPDTTTFQRFLARRITYNDTVLLATRRDSVLTAGIRSAATGPRAAVYPNPGAGLLSVESAAGIEAVRVYNLTGQQIHPPARQLSTGWEVDLRAAPGGFYLLRITYAGGGAETVRVAKE